MCLYWRRMYIIYTLRPIYYHARRRGGTPSATQRCDRDVARHAVSQLWPNSWPKVQPSAQRSARRTTLPRHRRPAHEAHRARALVEKLWSTSPPPTQKTVPWGATGTAPCWHAFGDTRVTVFSLEGYASGVRTTIGGRGGRVLWGARSRSPRPGAGRARAPRVGSASALSRFRLFVATPETSYITSVRLFHSVSQSQHQPSVCSCAGRC